MTTKACTRCDLHLPPSAFYESGGRLSSACRPCFRRRGKGYVTAQPAARAEQRSASADHLRKLLHAAKDVPCTDCGQRFPPYVMDFDHVRGVKRANVANMATSNFSEESVRAEIAKCEVVCANCHRIRTHQRRDAVRKPVDETP